MGNKKSRLAIEGGDGHVRTPHTRAVKSRVEQNNVAREILGENVSNRLPTDDEIKVAIAIQQSQVEGPLKKTDLIAILIRLNPSRDTALISQYKVQDLTDIIRHELYVAPIKSATVASRQQKFVQELIEG